MGWGPIPVRGGGSELRQFGVSAPPGVGVGSSGTAGLWVSGWGSPQDPGVGDWGSLGGSHTWAAGGGGRGAPRGAVPSGSARRGPADRASTAGGSSLWGGGGWVSGQRDPHPTSPPRTPKLTRHRHEDVPNDIKPGGAAVVELEERGGGVRAEGETPPPTSAPHVPQTPPHPPDPPALAWPHARSGSG